MADLAAVSDIEAQWRALSSAESTRATALLPRASAIIRTQVPDVDDRIDSGALDEEIPKGVAVDMVVRVLASPTDDVASVTVDDSTFRYRTGNDDRPSGTLHITSDELDLLSGRSSTRRKQVGTLRVNPTLKP